jgi:DNA invertase Pin-like site-specific DNA recombinase
MSKEYGYTRISTPKQNINRQVRNILAEHPQAHMIKEVFTGTKFQGRKELDKLLRTVKSGDTIIFDSVSRMSRNAEEGFLLYQDLFNQGINLVFLKEPHINTDTYKRALQGGIPATGTNVDFILDGVNKYLLALAKEQIRLAFEQAEKEVQDLHQRTAEGIETARLAGKQIGQKPGTHLVTKKSIAAKEIIMKHNKSFGGSLNDIETIRQAGITRKRSTSIRKNYCQILLLKSNVQEK